DRGDMVEFEERYSPAQRRGAIRTLGFIHHTNSGNYAEAVHLADQSGTVPDVTTVRRVGTRKYGLGISAEQELTKDLGAFLCLGWNDGKTASFAFTTIDRLVSGGVSMAGSPWRRPFDVIATVLTVRGISGVHSLYLTRGGHEFLIGDGTLRYGPEEVWESSSNEPLSPGVFLIL